MGSVHMARRKRYRIGVDVGGTNTDAVLLSLDSPIEIASFHKTLTTADVTTGIIVALQAVIFPQHDGAGTPTIPLSAIEGVIIGTTHFVNAVVQRSSRLRRVAVVRLSGGRAYGFRVPPFVDFPSDLRQRLSTQTYFCQGGFQIDGSEISAVDEVEIRRVGKELVSEGITDVVVAGMYSPINAAQEEHVAALLHETMSQEFQVVASVHPAKASEIRITLSHNISSLGFLARENAAILNASLRPLAEETIRGFERAMETIFVGEASGCALYLTQNDGSVLSAEDAIKFPIRTFNSGPTNSIRGGAFLWRAAAAATAGKTDNGIAEVAEEEPSAAGLVVVDIGGTTTDAGLLLPNGLPRMSSVASYVGGVKTNFGLPAVESIGLGGGSIVRQNDRGRVTVGPDSVGFEIQTKAKVFGGAVTTATDIAMAALNKSDTKTTSSKPVVGDISLVADLPPGIVVEAQDCIKNMLESLIDRAKIQKDDIDVLIVGGGALVVDTDQPLKGLRRCRTVKGGEVANAVGAAISQVGGTADMVMDLSSMSAREAQGVVKQTARETAAKNGAKEDTIEIAEVTVLPVQYMQGKARIIATAVGELDIVRTKSKVQERTNGVSTDHCEQNMTSSKSSTVAEISDHTTEPETPVFLDSYRPVIENNEWIVSPTDLLFISTGCKILGCGGGGDPYIEFLQTRTRLLSSPGTVRIISPSSLPSTATVGWAGNMGSPEVSAERLEANECLTAQLHLMDFMSIPHTQLSAMVALEIGGANGLVNFSVAADLGVPVVDADYMGRAYPTYWQTTANVDDTTGSGSNLVPACIASGDGSVIIMSHTKSDKLIDKALRAACVEMGSRAGKAARPQTGAAVRAQAVTNTVSLAWRVGRAVEMGKKNIAGLAELIIEEVGGEGSAKKVFEGKIVGVERTLMKGHTYGVCEIEGVDEHEGTTARIPFKNENALVEVDDPTEASGVRTLVSVPDLIAVLDAETGRGLGVQEYKYGLKVIVICIAASPRWTHTARGLELGGPASMGFDDVVYRPVGTYKQPRSVIEEFGGM